MKKLLLLLVLFSSASRLPAQENQRPHQLLVGDMAPVLYIDKWLKGTPVNMFQEGKVYLIDFWATWCGPCIANLSHLSEISRKYKDKGLFVIGVTSEDSWGNSYDHAYNFVNNRNGANYNFAWLTDSYRGDHKYRSIIYNPWITAAYDTSGWALPQIFLIDKHGKIAFIGDSYSLTDQYLTKVLNDNYDLEQERSHYINQCFAELKMLTFSHELSNKNYSQAFVIGDSLLNSPNVTSHITMEIASAIFEIPKSANSNKQLFDLGFSAAEKGVQLTNSLSAGHLSLLAKGYALKNDKQKAISTIKKALDLSEGEFKEAIKKDLNSYQTM